MSNALKNLRPENARKMASDLSSRQTMWWVGVAALIHLVLIAATSVGYVRDRWIDPAGAAARAAERAQAEAANNPQQPAASESTAKPPTTVTPPPDAHAKAPSPEEEKALLEQRKNNPEVKKVTESAKPGEIPKTPSHNGFNLDDSSLK